MKCLQAFPTSALSGMNWDNGMTWGNPSLSHGMYIYVEIAMRWSCSNTENLVLKL